MGIPDASPEIYGALDGNTGTININYDIYYFGELMRYEIPEDLQLRLVGSIVRWKTRPVLVLAAGERLTVAVRDIIKGDIETVDPNDDRFDITSPPLGYCNEGLPLYISRGVLRQQKQGLDPQRLSIIFPSYNDEKSFRWNTYISLGKTILGEYPSFDESRESEAGLAWSRKTALGRINGVPVVLYRGDAVGLYNKKSNTVRLQPKFKLPPIIEAFSQYITVD